MLNINTITDIKNSWFWLVNDPKFWFYLNCSVSAIMFIYQNSIDSSLFMELADNYLLTMDPSGGSSTEGTGGTGGTGSGGNPGPPPGGSDTPPLTGGESGNRKGSDDPPAGQGGKMSIDEKDKQLKERKEEITKEWEIFDIFDTSPGNEELRKAFRARDLEYRDEREACNKAIANREELWKKLGDSHDTRWSEYNSKKK